MNQDLDEIVLNGGVSPKVRELFKRGYTQILCNSYRNKIDVISRLKMKLI